MYLGLLNPRRTFPWRTGRCYSTATVIRQITLGISRNLNEIKPGQSETFSPIKRYHSSCRCTRPKAIAQAKLGAATSRVAPIHSPENTALRQIPWQPPAHHPIGATTKKTKSALNPDSIALHVTINKKAQSSSKTAEHSYRGLVWVLPTEL